MAKNIVIIIAALALGVVVPFSFSPHGVYPLVALSIAALLLLCRGRSRRAVTTLWFSFGIGMFGYGVWWVQVSVHQFGLPLIAFSASVTAGLVVIQALHLALLGWLVQPLIAARRPLLLYLGVPAGWTLIEMLRSWTFTGFPWLLVGYSQTDSLLASIAPVAGAFGVSYAVTLIAVAISRLSVSSERPGAAAMIALVVCIAWIAHGPAWVQPLDGEVREAALIQGAIPQSDKWRPTLREPSLELYAALSNEHWGKALIIWPETAIPAFPDEVPEFLERMGRRARRSGSTFLVGAPTRDAARSAYYNSVIQLGQQTGHYHKRHLVPFGEYMPFDSMLRPILDFLRIPMSDFSAGADREFVLDGGEFTLGVSICYEDAYSRLVRQSVPAANVLVNVSNDAWFGDTIAPHQHLQIARMRAIETGRFLLRATNTGISAIIAPSGAVTHRSKQFQPDVISGEFKPMTGSTPFVRFGLMPIVLWCVVSALVSAWLARTPRR